jgi:hypothetical protein
MLLQCADRGFLDRFPEFTCVLRAPLPQGANRDPEHPEIYPENTKKWTFAFLFAFLKEPTEGWVKHGRCRHHAKQNKRSQIKSRKCDEEAILKVVTSNGSKSAVCARLCGISHNRSRVSDESTELTNWDNRNRGTENWHPRTLLHWSGLFTAPEAEHDGFVSVRLLFR